ncbi:MAG: hypothetical protein RIC55_27675 [Pirellulaceae bacterium]
MLVDAAALELAADAFSGDRLATEGTLEQAARVGKFGSTRSSITAVQHILAGVKRGPVDQPPITSLKHLSIALQFPDVESVVEYVGKRRAVEARLALAEDVPFVFKLVGERFERVASRGVKLKDTNQRPRLLRMRLHRFVAVLDVEVAVGGEARRPSLPHLFIHPLQYFRPQIIAVVLGDGGHHVERQRSCGTGAKLVIDEGQLHAARVFEFLEPDGVSHVATDAVELVAQYRLDLLTFGIGLHPGEHLIKCTALRTSLR